MPVGHWTDPAIRHLIPADPKRYVWPELSSCKINRGLVSGNLVTSRKQLRLAILNQTEERLGGVGEVCLLQIRQSIDSRPCWKMKDPGELSLRVRPVSLELNNRRLQFGKFHLRLKEAFQASPAGTRFILRLSDPDDILEWLFQLLGLGNRVLDVGEVKVASLDLFHDLEFQRGRPSVSGHGLLAGDLASQVELAKPGEFLGQRHCQFLGTGGRLNLFQENGGEELGIRQRLCLWLSLAQRVGGVLS